MRKRTIKRRLRFSQLNDKYINRIFERMYGIRDKETLRGEGQWLWYRAVMRAYRDQAKEDKKAGIKRFVSMPKETLAESMENFSSAWKRFIDTVLKEIKNMFTKKNKGKHNDYNH